MNLLAFWHICYCMIPSICLNLFAACISILYCANKQTSEARDVRLRLISISTSSAASLSMSCSDPWFSLVHCSPGAKITWKPLHAHPHDFLLDCSSSETQTAYDYVQNKDRRPSTHMRTCHHNHNHKQTRTNPGEKTSSCVFTNGRGALTALWWHLIPSIAFLLLMVWGASTHCLTQTYTLIDTHTLVQLNICCF